MLHILLVGLPLAMGLALALVAGRRGWAPSLRVALVTGVVLRLTVMLLAAGDSWQPYDLDLDFRATADAVLAGHDPLVYVRPGGWHFLPFMAYVLAAQRELGHALGLPWSVAGRIVPVLADLGLIPLVGRLAEDRRDLRAFQYACAPLGIMISAIHGQFPPLVLLFGVAALVAAREGRGHAAGLLIGLAVTSASWAGLLLPGVLLAAPAARARLTALGWTVVVPAVFVLSGALFLGIPPGGLPGTVAKALSVRPVTGDWGWSALAMGGNQVVSAGLARVGTPVLALGLLAAAWWWRRADPVRLTTVLLLAFLIVTYRFGTQYLLWPVPYLIARPPRGTWLALAVSAAWAAAGYVVLTRLDQNGWETAHTWWALSSVLVIAFLVRVLPPRPAVATAPAGTPGDRLPPVAAG